MSDMTYQATMDRLAMLAGLLEDEPIAEMLRDLDRVDTIGPILDPTGYREGMRNVQEQRELLSALREVQEIVLRHRVSHDASRGGTG